MLGGYEMKIYEVAEKLIGPINPVGETNEDNLRFDSLKEMCGLVEGLLKDINIVAQNNEHAPEYSRQRARKYAREFLHDLDIEI
jgi:hypothetical protein